MVFSHNVIVINLVLNLTTDFENISFPYCEITCKASPLACCNKHPPYYLLPEEAGHRGQWSRQSGICKVHARLPASSLKACFLTCWHLLPSPARL